MVAERNDYKSFRLLLPLRAKTAQLLEKGRKYADFQAEEKTVSSNNPYTKCG